MEEDRAVKLIRAAEAVGSDRVVAAGLPSQHRSMEPWVIEASASLETLEFGYLAFCPLHQRPTSPMGQMGVEIAFTLVAHDCPGMFMGFYHPQGDEACEQWAMNHQNVLLDFMDKEIERTEEEIDTKDFKQPPGTRKLGDDEMKIIFEHWERYLESLVKWRDRLRSGELVIKDGGEA